MKFSLCPHYAFRSLTDISPDFLVNLNIEFLMLDLDNTAARYGEREPSPAVRAWSEHMSASGIELFFVSNSKRAGRVEAFAEALGVGYIKNARKPSPKRLIEAMKTAGYSARKSALAGDQIFTDVIASRLAGVCAISVVPLNLNNPLFLMRYALELPLRAVSAAIRLFAPRKAGDSYE